MGKMKELLPDEDLHDYDFYDGVEDDFYIEYSDDEYDPGYTDYVQAFNDRLDFAREQYEAGEIDAVQLAEKQAGA